MSDIAVANEPVAAEVKRLKQALNAPRREFYLLDPDEVVLVIDKKHPLYDSRVEKPLTEAFISSIRRFGVRKTIEGRKNGLLNNGQPRVEITEGRRRIIGAREVNKRLRAEGLEPIRVPVQLIKGSDADMDIAMVIGNEGRVDDDLVTKARKANRLIELHGLEKTADAFSVSSATVTAWLKILDLGDDVQAKIQAGEITTAAAGQLVDLSREEQTAVVGALEAGGKKLTHAKVKKAVADCRTPRKQKAIETYKAAKVSILRVALSYALGKAKLDDLKEAASDFGRATEAKKATK